MTDRRFAVIGDGAMGTACALVLSANGHSVTMWCPQAENAALLAAERENRRFLPGVPLPKELRTTATFPATGDFDALVLAIPMVYLRDALAPRAKDWDAGTPIVSVVKGIERETYLRPSEVTRSLIGPAPFVALTGPSHAEEVARRKPAGLIAASEDEELAIEVQRWFSNETFRVYSATDLVGAELAGALKNVIAIAAGISDGLGLGDNAKSALMTRGLAEITRLGRRLGGKEETFFGIAGLGDLITTCISGHGRNLQLGRQLAAGRKLDEILAGTRQVFEGVWTAASVRDLAAREACPMPIAEEVHRILFEGKSPRDAVTDLMNRDLKSEWGERE